MVSLYGYFTLEELRCKCDLCVEMDSPTVPRPIIMEKMRLIRAAFGKPIVVSCGIRCTNHNMSIGGEHDSRHLPEHGDAVDIECHDSISRFQLISLATRWNVSVIEVCQNHLHFDMRPTPAPILFLGVDK